MSKSEINVETEEEEEIGNEMKKEISEEEKGTNETKTTDSNIEEKEEEEEETRLNVHSEEQNEIPVNEDTTRNESDEGAGEEEEEATSSTLLTEQHGNITRKEVAATGAAGGEKEAAAAEKGEGETSATLQTEQHREVIVSNNNTGKEGAAVGEGNDEGAGEEDEEETSLALQTQQRDEVTEQHGNTGKEGAASGEEGCDEGVGTEEEVTSSTLLTEEHEEVTVHSNITRKEEAAAEEKEKEEIAIEEKGETSATLQTEQHKEMIVSNNNTGKEAAAVGEGNDEGAGEEEEEETSAKQHKEVKVHNNNNIKKEEAAAAVGEGIDEAEGGEEVKETSAKLQTQQQKEMIISKNNNHNATFLGNLSKRLARIVEEMEVRGRESLNASFVGLQQHQKQQQHRLLRAKSRNKSRNRSGGGGRAAGTLKAELDSLRASSLREKSKHDMEIFQLEKERDALRQQFAALERYLKDESKMEQYDRFVATIQAKDPKAYIDLLKAQLTHTMHKMDVKAKQMDNLKQTYEAMIRDLKIQVADKLDQWSKSEVELMNQLSALDRDKMIMEGRLKEEIANLEEELIHEKHRILFGDNEEEEDDDDNNIYRSDSLDPAQHDFDVLEDNNIADGNPEQQQQQTQQNGPLRKSMPRSRPASLRRLGSSRTINTTNIHRSKRKPDNDDDNDDEHGSEQTEEVHSDEIAHLDGLIKLLEMELNVGHDSLSSSIDDDDDDDVSLDSFPSASNAKKHDSDDTIAQLKREKDVMEEQFKEKLRDRNALIASLMLEKKSNNNNNSSSTPEPITTTTTTTSN